MISHLPNMPGHTHLIHRNQFDASMGFYLQKKKNLIHQLTLEILKFQVYCNPKILLGLNTRIKILPAMGFAMRSQELQELSFQTTFKKIIWDKIFAET